MSMKPLYNAWRDYLSLRAEAPVRQWLDDFDWNLSERNIRPNPMPGVKHLDGIEENVGKGEKRLVSALIEYACRGHWLRSYTADDFGQDFVDNYAHLEIIGTRGHFASNELAGGFVIFGPGLQYPDHWHVAEEIYFPLTNGTLWSRDEGAFETRASGEFIFHESNMPHAMTMQDKPLLALWLWRGGDLAQKGNY